MKKIPVFTSILLIAGVLATMAFSRPLVVDNGVVRGVSANLSNGGSLDLRNNGQVTTFIVRQGAAMFPSGATVAAGDHVTILADCFHPQTTNRSANGTTANTSNGRGNNKAGNEHVCIALAIMVRKGAVTAASGGTIPATGGTATGTSAPSTSGATGSATPAASATSAASATPAASATTAGGTGSPMLCPTATATMMAGTGTPTSTPTTMAGTATATATPMAPCVTPTP